MDSDFDFDDDKKHKRIPARFTSVADGVKKRFEYDLKKRKVVRESSFDRIRNLPLTESLTPVKEIQSKVEHRQIQLKKWKEEKEKKKIEAFMNKKKPFIVGKAPTPLKFVLPPPLRTTPSPSVRVTRSHTKNRSTNVSKHKVKEINLPKNPSPAKSFAPKNATFNPLLKNIARLTLAMNYETVQKDAVKTRSKLASKVYTPRNLRKRAVDKKNKVLITVKAPSLSISSSIVEIAERNSKPIEQTFLVPKNKVPKSESSSQEQLKSSTASDMMTPEQISQEVEKINPCVTLSRGKGKARLAMKKKRKDGLFNNDVYEMDKVEYFRHQLDSEMKRLTELCDSWSKILEQMVLPDAVQEAILVTVGQARLLMSQKLQLTSLLLRCECPDLTQALVTPGDLHGFFDMVFMEVTKVDMRFKKLEKMRAHGWQEEQPVIQKKKIITKTPMNRSKPTVNSRLRDMIAAARKTKKEQQTPTYPFETKKFEAGFFFVTSPGISPGLPSTPNQSLLKAVLSSEAEHASASKLDFTDAIQSTSYKEETKTQTIDMYVPEKEENLDPDFDTLHDMEEQFDSHNFDECSKYEIISTDSPDIISSGRRTSRKIRSKNFEFGAPLSENEASTSFNKHPIRTLNFEDDSFEFTSPAAKKSVSVKKSLKFCETPPKNPLRHERSDSSIGPMSLTPCSTMRIFPSESTTSSESGFISELEKPFLNIEEISNSPKIENFNELLTGQIKDNFEFTLKRPLQRSLRFQPRPKSLFTIKESPEMTSKRNDFDDFDNVPSKRRKSNCQSPSKVSRPILQRAFSENNASIMTALAQSAGDPDLIGDFSLPFALPLIMGDHGDLKSISCDTLAGLLRGEYEHCISDFKVIDCRYPYEYEGGHILGALNLYTQPQILSLVDEPVKPREEKRSILVFHCEFSLERGPKLFRYLRSSDRAKHKENYPSLNYPEVYLLHQGYKSFYNKFSDLCSPAGYTAMLDPKHRDSFKKHQSTQGSRFTSRFTNKYRNKLL